MKGAIAAGHPLTAEAGARVLESGGNAVDACIAAAFAAFVTEGPLTGPAGGGFLLAHVEGETTLLDCFFSVPTEPLGQIEHLTVDYGSTTQSYHVGDGSIAVPGLLAGLSEAHARFGRVPWRELVAPAIELARAGVDVSAAQVFLHELLVNVLQRDEGGRRIYGDPAHLDTSELAATLEQIGDDPVAAVRDLVPELAADLDAYCAADRDPLRTTIDGRDVLTTPPPSRGGAIVAAALAGFRGERLARRARAGAALRLRRRLDRRDRRHDPRLGDRRGRQRRRALVHARRRLGRPPRRHAAQQHARRVRRDRPRRARAGRAARRA